MKKYTITLICVASVLFGGCQQSDILDLDNNTKSINVNNEVSEPAFFNVSLNTAKYTATMLSDANVKSIIPVVSQPNDTVIYIVNYTDGWLLLSADKRAVPILASSPKGEFNQDLNNPGSSAWLNDLANSVLNLKQQNPKVNFTELKNNPDFQFWMKMEWGAKVKNLQIAANDSSPTTRALTTRAGTIKTYLCKRFVSNQLISHTKKVLNDRLKTSWGQGSPWNAYLPFVLDNNVFVLPPAGCTAVAMAQLLYFTHFKYNAPSGLNHGVRYGGVIVDADNYNTNYISGTYVDNSPRWELMPLSAFLPSEETGYVAELLAELGYKLSMNYGPSGSGAFVSGDIFREYGVTWDENAYDTAKVNKDLIRGLPVLITAYADKWTSGWWFWKRTRYGNGHAWLIDGLCEQTHQYETKYVWEVVKIVEDDESKAMSINDNLSFINSYSATAYSGESKTLSDLYIEYEEVLDIATARKMGKYNGLVEIETPQYTSRLYLMNWGWDGVYNEVEYAPAASAWSVAGNNFQFEKKIYHNVRKLN